MSVSRSTYPITLSTTLVGKSWLFSVIGGSATFVVVGGTITALTGDIFEDEFNPRINNASIKLVSIQDGATAQMIISGGK